MGNVLKFFLNALKAIFFSPFYICYFLIFFIIGIFNHIIGELRVLISGFRFASEKENKYSKKLLAKKRQIAAMKNGGDEL